MSSQLDTVEAAYADRAPFDYNGYRVRWRGWIASIQTDHMVGGWVGYPSRLLPEIERLGTARWPCLVAIVNSATCGSYEPGATWDIRPAGDDPWIVYDDFFKPEGLVRTTQLRDTAKHRLLTMIDGLHTGRFPGVCQQVEVIIRDKVTKAPIEA